MRRLAGRKGIAKRGDRTKMIGLSFLALLGIKTSSQLTLSMSEVSCRR